MSGSKVAVGLGYAAIGAMVVIMMTSLNHFRERYTSQDVLLGGAGVSAVVGGVMLMRQQPWEWMAAGLPLGIIIAAYFLRPHASPSDPAPVHIPENTNVGAGTCGYGKRCTSDADCTSSDCCLGLNWEGDAPKLDWMPCDQSGQVGVGGCAYDGRENVCTTAALFFHQRPDGEPLLPVGGKTCPDGERGEYCPNPPT